MGMGKWTMATVLGVGDADNLGDTDQKRSS